MTNVPAGSADIFDQIVLVADGRLGTDPIEDIFRASLISGAACARSMVARVEALRDGWDEENQIGAALLTEFWGAVIAARLLGQVEDRDEVILAICERFAGDLFGSSVSSLAWSLQTFEAQLVMGMEIDPDGGAPSAGPMTWNLLYWRSRDLLVGDLPLQNRYHPAPDFDGWRADRRHEGVEPPADTEGPEMAREILLWGLDTASKHFAALRSEAEANEG